MKESKHSGMQLGRDAVHHRGEEEIDPPAVHSMQWSGPKEERGMGGCWDPTKEQTQTHWDLAKSFRQQLPNPLFTKIQPLWLESILELPPERYLEGNSFFLLVSLFELDWSFLPEKGDAIEYCDAERYIPHDHWSLMIHCYITSISISFRHYPWYFENGTTLETG